jgi:hypothetical protein
MVTKLIKQLAVGIMVGVLIVVIVIAIRRITSKKAGIYFNFYNQVIGDSPDNFPSTGEIPVSLTYTALGTGNPQIVNDTNPWGSTCLEIKNPSKWYNVLKSEPTNNLFNIAHTDSFTIQIGLKFANLLGKKAIISKDWDPDKPSWWIRTNSNKIQFMVEPAEGGKHNQLSGVNKLPVNTWFILQIVGDRPDGTIKSYINGVLDLSVAYNTTSTHANEQNFNIGNFTAGDHYFNSKIAFFSFIKGTALLPAEFYTV